MKSMLISLMSVAAAALALTSCSTDATDEAISKGGSKTLVVNATIDQTRTVMATDDHSKLEWADNDEILLYIGETATTANKIKPKTGGTITGVTYEDGKTTVYANYSIDNEKFSKGVTQAQINIKNVQTQSKANVFAGENLPMVAKGTIANGAVDLTFNPVGCVLVFNVYGSPYNSNEQIKSIKFETSVGCYGYANCNLTLDKLNYEAYNDAKDKSVTVTLTTPATIGVSKPSDTKKGENQVYMVVAPVNYEAATITVNTTIDPQKGDIFNTYTFKTSSGIDCSQYTARVVNLNLANAAVVPSIDVPTVPQQLSDGGDLTIENIVFKNIEADQINNADVRVYSDKELTAELADSWLTIPNTATLATGVLNCKVAANETTESRTAYIGIKCGDVQAAIPVTQVAPGASTAKYFVKVTETLDDWTGDYLIVYEKSATEAYVWNLTDDGGGNYITASISNSSILSKAETTNACIVSISKSKSGEGYLLCATAGKNKGNYIYRNSTKNGTDFGTQENAEKKLNKIIIENSSATITSNGLNYRFNKSSGQERFRYFGSQQQYIQLYKLQ